MLDRLQRLQTFKENEDSVLQPPPSRPVSKRSLPTAPSLKRRPSGGLATSLTQTSTKSLGTESTADSFNDYEYEDEDWIDGEPLVVVSKQFAVVWWIGVFLAIVGPELIAYWADVHDSLQDMRNYEQEIISFPSTHPLYVPKRGDDLKKYDLLDESLIAWQEDLTVLYDKVLSLKVLDGVSDTNLEFSFATGVDEFESKRDLTIFIYFVMCIAVYFTDNVHLALVLLHFNLYNLVVCIRVKSLDDAVNKVLDPLESTIQDFLMLGVGKTDLEIAQQQFLLSKLESMLRHWGDQNLGISFAVPVFRTVLSLNIGLLISLVAATTVRCLNVVLYGFYPSLPRVNFLQLFIQWMVGSQNTLPQGTPMGTGLTTPVEGIPRQGSMSLEGLDRLRKNSTLGPLPQLPKRGGHRLNRLADSLDMTGTLDNGSSHEGFHDEKTSAFEQ